MWATPPAVSQGCGELPPSPAAAMGVMGIPYPLFTWISKLSLTKAPDTRAPFPSLSYFSDSQSWTQGAISMLTSDISLTTPTLNLCFSGTQCRVALCFVSLCCCLIGLPSQGGWPCFPHRSTKKPVVHTAVSQLHFAVTSSLGTMVFLTLNINWDQWIHSPITLLYCQVALAYPVDSQIKCRINISLSK